MARSPRRSSDVHFQTGKAAKKPGLRRWLGLLACAACAGSNANITPRTANFDWTELRSAHFILDTDASDAEAAAIIAKLEKLRALVLQAMVGEQVLIPGHIRVLAPRNNGAFLDISGQDVAGKYYLGPDDVPFIAVAADDFSSGSLETIAHEVTHAVSFYLFPEQPRWFAEGIAQFTQTVGNNADTRDATIGTRIGNRAIAANAAGAVPRFYEFATADPGAIVPPAQLFEWHGVEDPAITGRYHLTSWLLYHWLWNKRSKAFAAFQKQLGDGVDWQKAWRDNLPEFDLDNPGQMKELENQLRDYRKQGRFTTFQVKADFDGRAEVQPVSPADVRLWMLDARASWPDDPKARAAIVRREVELAHAEDPSNPRAALMLAELDKRLDVSVARSIARSTQGDYRGWRTLAALTPDPAEKEQALRKAVELNPECAPCKNNLAWLLASEGRSREALPLINGALDLAPWNAASVDTLAEVASQLQQCPQAMQLEERYVRMSSRDEKTRQGAEKRSAEVQARCAAMPAASAK
jgi:hypothetical protein